MRHKTRLETLSVESLLGWSECCVSSRVGRMGREVDVTLPNMEVVMVMPDPSNNLVEQALAIFGRLWDSLVYMEREEEMVETSKENLRVILLLILLLVTLASLCLCLLAILCCTCRAVR